MGNYLPDGLPAPQPSHDDFEFWDSCSKHELRIQQCPVCATFRHPPRPSCARCGHFGARWTQVSGRGTVFSYTVAHHPVHRALRETVPYNVAVVLLDDAGDVRLVSNVIDATPGEMHIGMPVEVAWEDLAGGMSLARFRKRKEA